MNKVGGYFELELPAGSESFHPNALELTTGRACLSVLLDRLQPDKVFLPFYCCDVVSNLLKARDVPTEYLQLDNTLDVISEPVLGERDVFLYVNYFGLKGKSVSQYRERYGTRMILDNTQAFFDVPPEGSYSFNSARKFFGVPDGAYLYPQIPIEQRIPDCGSVDCTHLVERFNGHQEAGFAAFRRHESSLDFGVRRMSALSKALLSLVDYSAAIDRRRTNFLHYQRRLGSRNQLELDLDDGVPFCFPFLTGKGVQRAGLASRGIFVPTFWIEIVQSEALGFEWEKDLAARLLPLPLDHRYDEQDIDYVIKGVLHAIGA